MTIEQAAREWAEADRRRIAAKHEKRRLLKLTVPLHPNTLYPYPACAEKDDPCPDCANAMASVRKWRELMAMANTAKRRLKRVVAKDPVPDTVTLSREDHEELLDALVDATNHAAWTNPNTGLTESQCIGAVADALRLCAKLGRFVISEDHGRHVRGWWTTSTEDNA